MTDDPLKTFGNRAVAHIPRLQELMHHVCENGFEHHVVMNASHTGGRYRPSGPMTWAWAKQPDYGAF